MPLSAARRRRILRRHRRSRRRSLAGDHRLRPAQLQPEPHGEADDDRSRHRLRPRRRPQGPADPEPDHAVAVGDPDDHGDAARGLLDQPNAADGKVACSDAAARSGPCDAADCPEFSKIGTLDARQRGAAGADPGRASTSANRSPANRTGCSSPPTASRPTSSCSARSTPTRRPGQVVDRLRRPAAAPAAGVQPALLRLRARPARDPDPVRHLPGEERLRPLGRRPCRPRTRPASSRSTPGPTAPPCPTARGRFAPELRRPASPTTPPASTRPSRSTLDRERRRPEPDRARRSRRRPGFSATLKGVPYCPEAAIAAARQPGLHGRRRAALARLPGREPGRHRRRPAPAPARTRSTSPGKVYLAGPYKGAPLSLVVVVPAVSGPYDLGNVVVRAALDVDPVTAQVTTVSDPLPQILEGIPLRIRSIQVNLDRPELHAQPDQLRPVRGRRDDRPATKAAPADRSVHFQVANCADLPFAPKLSLKLTGGAQAPRPPGDPRDLHGRSPAKRTPARSSVALPKGELLDNAHIGTICTRVAVRRRRLPGGLAARHGRGDDAAARPAAAGNVYLRSSDNELPDLVVDLEGQIDIELAAAIDTVKAAPADHLRSRPRRAGQPASSLDLAGGTKGLLQNSESLCGKPKKATTTMIGQNGAVVKTKTKLQTACGAKARHKRGPSGRRPGSDGADGRPDRCRTEHHYRGKESELEASSDRNRRDVRTQPRAHGRHRVGDDRLRLRLLRYVLRRLGLRAKPSLPKASAASTTTAPTTVFYVARRRRPRWLDHEDHAGRSRCELHRHGHAPCPRSRRGVRKPVLLRATGQPRPDRRRERRELLRRRVGPEIRLDG